jgi:hypothetical protein
LWKEPGRELARNRTWGVPNGGEPTKSSNCGVVNIAVIWRTSTPSLIFSLLPHHEYDAHSPHSQRPLQKSHVHCARLHRELVIITKARGSASFRSVPCFASESVRSLRIALKRNKVVKRVGGCVASPTTKTKAFGVPLSNDAVGCCDWEVDCYSRGIKPV